MSCAALPVFLLMLALPFCQDLPTSQPVAQAQPEPSTDEPRAKSQEELEAFVAATGTQDPARAEGAIDEFVAKYPESELKAAAYVGLMQREQHAKNLERSLALGRKALQHDPRNILALIVTASNLVDTAERAPDAASRYAEAIKNTDAAIAQIDAGGFIAVTSSPGQLEGLRSSLLTAAYTARGLAASKKKDYSEAEVSLRKAAEQGTGTADPTLYLQLAIVQDHLGKYSEALTSVNQAIGLADARKNGAVANAARSHKQRLTQLIAKAPKSKGKTKTR